MNTPRVYQRTAARNEIAAVVDGWRAHDLRFLYFESVDRIELVAYRTPSQDWAHGRAFGAELEVRWTWNGATFDVLLLTEKNWADLAGWTLRQTFDAAPDDFRVRLWGTQRKYLAPYHRLYQAESAAAEWVETRLPQVLVYPQPDKPRHVHLRGLTYRAAGVPAFTRWQAVEGSNE